MSGTITFPPNPTDGQLYTAPNGTTWIWHANPGVWANANTPTNFLPLSGGTMSGAITLPGNAATALQAVPLQQVVPIAGGTMTGALTLSGNAATALQATPLQQVNAVVAPAYNDVGRNLIHNALFNIQQRGAGGWTGGYTADRWIISVAGSDTSNASIISAADANRSQIGDEAARYLYYIHVVGSATAGSSTQFQQRIEKVQRLSGKTIIVSFWAASSVANLQVGLQTIQSFGTGGSPSASVASPVQRVTILGTGIFQQRYSVTFAMPSSAGKTFGTNGDDYTGIVFFMSDASGGATPVQSGDFYFWGMQCEVAQSGQTAPTPLEKLDPVLQLQQCQRFYQVVTVYGGAYISAAGGYVYAGENFVVSPRAAPTLVTISNTSANLSGATIGLSASNLGAIGYGTAATVGGTIVSITISASADL